MKELKDLRGTVTNKELRAVLQEYVREWGCKIFRLGNSHLVVVHPNGNRVVMGSTSSDWRALKNNKARLKRIIPSNS